MSIMAALSHVILPGNDPTVAGNWISVPAPVGRNVWCIPVTWGLSLESKHNLEAASDCYFCSDRGLKAAEALPLRGTTPVRIERRCRR